MSESRERTLALTLLPPLLLRERRAARALLRAEGHSLRALRSAVDAVVARATVSVVREGVDTRDAMARVRRTVPVLRESLERAVLQARIHARRASRKTVGATHGSAAHHEEDGASAHTAAGAFAAAWGAAAIAAILHAAETKEGTLARALSTEPHDFRLRRIASTETARAFNQERVEAVRLLHAPDSGLFKVWSAVLDRRTCGECFDRDGRTIALHASFGSLPPVHVNCRCVIEFVQVPLPLRLEDIAIDYDAFKREMRDVIRERRTSSERHAGAFVRTSMGRERSPVALTRKFRALVH